MTALHPVGEFARSSYLGYGLRITNRVVAIYAPDGRWLAECRSLAAARRRIRAHRGVKGRAA